MIITKTPFRMSFFGGGTDMPEFFKERKGSVISTTFDKYVYVTVRHLPRFFEYTTEIEYSKQERVSSVDDIEHPMVRNAMKLLDMHELHISYDADLPAKTGLGTSSTFAVGLLNAFYSLKGKYVSKEKLAKDAIYVERVMCNEAGGWQDQIAASYGGFNRIDFEGDEFKITPIVISPERKKQLDNNLLLFFTGFTRFSAEIQEAAKSSMKEKEKQLEKILALVDDAQDVLTNKERDLDDFGRLLDKTWQLKRGISKEVTTSAIDELYEKGIAAGALGGKLLGAGGGGFLLFYVPKRKQNAVRRALDLMEVPFEFENYGTRTVYYAPEVYDIKGNLEDVVEEEEE
ncbi:MAG: kinase [Bacilli bacterium]|nr:kinase [Bacilli bacterium]